MVCLKIGDEVYDEIELIIFDKDGTLFKLFPYCSKMVDERTKAICAVLKNDSLDLKEWLIRKMGIDAGNNKVFPEGPIGVYSKYYAQDMLFTALNERGYTITKDMLREAFSFADMHISQTDYLLDALVPVDGMVDFLRDVSPDCKCAIYSNDMTERLKISLQIFGIADNFDYVLGGDMVSKHKPDPEGIFTIAQDLGISLRKTMVIGDSRLDMECGKNAGCKYRINIISDISDARCGADKMISDFQSLRVVHKY